MSPILLRILRVALCGERVRPSHYSRQDDTAPGTFSISLRAMKRPLPALAIFVASSGLPPGRFITCSCGNLRASAMGSRPTFCHPSVRSIPCRCSTRDLWSSLSPRESPRPMLVRPSGRMSRTSHNTLSRARGLFHSFQDMCLFREQHNGILVPVIQIHGQRGCTGSCHREILSLHGA